MFRLFSIGEHHRHACRFSGHDKWAKIVFKVFDLCLSSFLFPGLSYFY